MAKGYLIYLFLVARYSTKKSQVGDRSHADHVCGKLKINGDASILTDTPCMSACARHVKGSFCPQLILEQLFTQFLSQLAI